VQKNYNDAFELVRAMYKIAFFGHGVYIRSLPITIEVLPRDYGAQSPLIATFNCLF